uniref:Ig-like domain-containing protein n=1 Tax=Timema monikensis TaxID=170555 RepID=A0A7R9HJG0_9NEOP|nr:unnamed protein product [Timema monikensis]
MIMVIIHDEKNFRCSVSCGEGVQTRVVHCKDIRGAPSRMCETAFKPSVMQGCRTGIPCPAHRPPFYDSGEYEHPILACIGRCPTSSGSDSNIKQRSYLTTRCTSPQKGEAARFTRLALYVPDMLALSRAQRTCVTSRVLVGRPVVLKGASVQTSRERFVGMSMLFRSAPHTHHGQQQSYTSSGISIEHLSGQGHTQPLVQPYPPPRPAPSSATAERLVGQQIVPSEATFIAENWGPCSASCGEGVRQREVHCKIFLEFSRTNARLPDQQCQGPKPPTTESCVVDLACPIENRFDQVGLRDGYGEPYPSETFRTHYSDTAIKVAPGSSGKTYSWKEQGFTHCSASCLGGVQESLITCLRDNDQKAVSPYLCPQEARPEILTRTCNDHPCPPRWNYSDFQPCTKSCGIGIQTREVNCIHEVTRGGSNTVIVPNSMCPQPPPLDRQYCNVLDCPIRWHTSVVEQGESHVHFRVEQGESHVHFRVEQGESHVHFLVEQVRVGIQYIFPHPQPLYLVFNIPPLCCSRQCSKTCGGGVKTRLVECKQVMAQNHVVQRPASKCPSTKPPDKKPCNTKSCVLESERPHIAASNTSYVQQNPSKKKVTLKIGGQAVVFWGTQIKIKCPVKRFNRTKIQWAKDHNYISNSKKYKISKKGALRIQDVTHRDSGIYTCVACMSLCAGLSTANLMLSVKPRPGEFLSSEEIERQNTNRVPEHAGLDDPNIESQGKFLSSEEIERQNTNRVPERAGLDDPNIESQGKFLSSEEIERQNTNRVPEHAGLDDPNIESQGKFLSSEEIERQNTNRVPERAGLDDPNIESQGPSQDDRRSFLPAVDDLSHELRPPGDVNPQSLLPKQNKIKLRPTPPLTPPAQSSEEDELTNPSILPAAVGGAAAAEPATSPPHLFDSLGDPPVPTSSGGSRPLPHFQQLLANLQTFGQSRGHRMVTEVLEQDHNHTDEVDDDEDSEEDSIGPIIILGKGKPENLKFDWMITEWSRCSQTCGGSGFQMRAAHCMVRLHNTTQNVDSNLCEDAGLVTPPTIQKCGVDDCPRWVPTNWSTCEDSRCFTWNTEGHPLVSRNTWRVFKTLHDPCTARRSTGRSPVQPFLSQLISGRHLTPTVGSLLVDLRTVGFRVIFPPRVCHHLTHTHGSNTLSRAVFCFTFSRPFRSVPQPRLHCTILFCLTSPQSECRAV